MKAKSAAGCPKCGGTRGYLIDVRTIGTVVHRGHWNVEGGDERIVRSELRSVAGKTVRCLDRGRRTLVKALRPV